MKPLSPAEFQAVQQAFESICDLPKAEQDTELDRLDLSEPAMAQLRRMLQHDGSEVLGSFSDRLRHFGLSLEDVKGKSVGAYTLERRIGEGGMGDVFLAHRSDGRFDAQVAIKFLAGSTSAGAKLFDRERRVLAQLEHPGIARLIDAGEDKHLGPYLVMEFVSGTAIDRYVRAHSMSWQEAIGLILHAAQAVDAAHRSLVLHRDLKPDHLVVTQDREVKILDFGVATTLANADAQSAATQSNSFTPRYAAPEQILGQSCTTATDVYALGLIIYELFSTGTTLFGSPDDDLLKRKLNGERITPRFADAWGLSKRQSVDLASIVLKATETEVSARYAGADELIADLHALLEDRPLLAGASRTSDAYVRWIRRHRLTAGLAGLAALAMIVGTGVSLWFAYQANAQRQVAESQAKRAETVAAFMEELFSASNPANSKGEDITAKTLLERGSERLQNELMDDPEVASDLNLSIARSFLGLGEYDRALEQLDIAADLPVDRNHPAIIVERGKLYNLKGLFTETKAHFNATPPQSLPHPWSVDALNTLSVALFNLGELDEAQRSAELAVSLSGDELGKRLIAQSMIGTVAYGKGDIPTALNSYSKILDIQMERFGPDHHRTALARHNYAGAAFSTGNLTLAKEQYTQAIAAFRAYYGVENRAVAMSLRSLGLSHRRAGEATKAEEVLTAAADAFLEWNGADHPRYHGASLQLAEVWFLTDREDLALERLQSLDLAEPQGSFAAQVQCRIITLRDAIAHPEQPLPECTNEEKIPASVRVFFDYLALRQQHFVSGEVSTQKRDEITQAIDDLKPSDPLLRQAVLQL